MTKPRYQAILRDDIPVVSLPLSAVAGTTAATTATGTTTNNSDSLMGDQPQAYPPTTKSTTTTTTTTDPTDLSLSSPSPPPSQSSDVVGTVRVIAGHCGATQGAAKTFSPVQVWDVHLPKAPVEIELPFPAHHNCILLVRTGGIEVLSPPTRKSSSSTSTKTTKTNAGGGVHVSKKNHQPPPPQLVPTPVGPHEVALLMHLDDNDNNNNNNNANNPAEATRTTSSSSVIRMRVTHAETNLLIAGGEPLREPIAAEGPFVMNTPAEIRKAVQDYERGKMGRT